MTPYVKRSLASKEQIQAINFGKGCAAVVAGPGSGKTFVLTQRIRTLVESFDVNPADILTITFTKAAAREMQSRFIRLTNAAYPEVTFGTFHSVFYRMNRMTSSSYPNRLMTNADKFHFMSGVLRHMGIPDRGDGARLYLSHLSLEKNRGEEVLAGREVLPGAEKYREVISLYNETVRDAGRLDFDDMASDCYRLLRKNQTALRSFRERFRYILIDEFQDINRTQYETIRLLAGDAANANLFVVGDDDQSIYGFRGSDPSFMQRVRTDFPTCKTFYLTGNYRSHREIIRSSLSVISENKDRFGKELHPAGENISGEEAGVFAYRYHTSHEEYEAIVERILKEHERHPFRDYAVLSRTNSELSRIAMYFMKREVPFYIKENITPVYEEETAKDLLCYLRFALGKRGKGDFVRIMNRPLRYFSRASVRDVCNGRVTRGHLLRFYNDKPYMHETINRMFDIFDRASRMRTDLALSYLVRALGYEQYVRKDFGEDGVQRFREIFETMKHDAKQYPAHEDFIAYAASDCEKMHEKCKEAMDGAAKRDAVGLVTIHGAKGLEYDTVFIPFLNEGVIPARAAISDSAQAEERRMLYVAMTRAKRRLILSYQTGGVSNTRMPSRFLKPIQHLWKE